MPGSRPPTPPRPTPPRARWTAVLLLAWCACGVACGEASEPGGAAAPADATAPGGAAAPADTSAPGGAAAPADTSVAAPEFVSRRDEFEALAVALIDGSNPYLGRAQIEQARAMLERPGLSPSDRLGLLAAQTANHLRWGELEQAEASIDAALAAAPGASAPPQMQLALWQTKALVHLRQAEVANCIARHDADCCLMPLRDGGVHTDRGPALAARAALERALELEPNQPEAGWLLNVVAMALGDHPDAVPAHLRIEPEAFASEAGAPRFRDVAGALGVDAFDQCGGVVVEDLDLDGRLDIVASSFDPRMPLHHWRGVDPEGAARAVGALAFEDHAAASRLDDQLGGLNLIGGDHDGDGDIDLLVLRGAWLYDDGRLRNSLLRNEGGVFTDVTVEAGLATPAAPTQAAAFGDFDDDGDLDLYVGNESRVGWGPPNGIPGGPGDFPSQLFRNDGDGSFTDVARQAGVTNDRYAKGVAAGDFDNDGDLDLYVSNVGPNRLYRNDGGLVFTDVAPELGVTEPEDRSFATWFFDVDEDGWLDLFVGGFRATIADVYHDTRGWAHQAVRPRLYRNTGGGFEDVTRDWGLTGAWLPMGASFADVDNDGWLDVYLATGDPGYQTLVPNVLLRNDEGRRFLDVTAAAGLGHLQKGHGVAFADLDGDGDQDLYHQLGGFFPGDAYANALFVNPGGGGRFLQLRLRGVRSNRQGVGVRVAVTVERADGSERTLHRAVGCGSSFGGSTLRQDIGLGDALRVVRLVIDWPTSGERQVFEDVPLDARLRVTEGASEWERLPLR